MQGFRSSGCGTMQEFRSTGGTMQGLRSSGGHHAVVHELWGAPCRGSGALGGTMQGLRSSGGNMQWFRSSGGLHAGF